MSTITTRAYRWAEGRRVERHPKTGAAQLVEIRETVREIEMPRVAAVEAPFTAPRAAKPALFADTADDVLLGYGVPEVWLDDVRRADKDTLLDLADPFTGRSRGSIGATRDHPGPPGPLTTVEGSPWHPHSARHAGATPTCDASGWTAISSPSRVRG